MGGILSDFSLTEEQLVWIAKRRQRVAPTYLRELLIAQKGRCALSQAEMLFNLVERTPVRGARGCHPLSPAVDHVDPGNNSGRRQLVCYALNDLKGHLPVDCFDALQKTDPWIRLMEAWRAQAIRNPSDREAFKRLLRPNAAIRRPDKQANGHATQATEL